MSEPIVTVFLGSGGFAVPVLERLASLPGIRLQAVVTAPPRRAGRGQRERVSPVGAWAADAGIASLTPERLRAPESVAALRELAPDLLVLADYGQIVPVPVLDLPRHGPLNLHPSLLPRHRGATPISAAILAGDAETGVSLLRMDAGLDTGPVVAQRRTPIGPDETAPELEAQLARLAGELLAEELPGWLAGRTEAVAQPEQGVTLTRPLHREDGRLDPTRAAVDLVRQVRAYQPWPGSYLDSVAGRLIVRRAATAAAGGSPVEPGTFIVTAEGDVAISTSDGPLRLLEVQPAGGRSMTGQELLRGRPGLVGSVAT